MALWSTSTFADIQLGTTNRKDLKSLGGLKIHRKANRKKTRLVGDSSQYLFGTMRYSRVPEPLYRGFAREVTSGALRLPALPSLLSSLSFLPSPILPCILSIPSISSYPPTLLSRQIVVIPSLPSWRIHLSHSLPSPPLLPCAASGHATKNAPPFGSRYARPCKARHAPQDAQVCTPAARAPAAKATEKTAHHARVTPRITLPNLPPPWPTPSRTS